MKITILVDNIGDENLAGEWGLSFYIEYHGKKILLDAGASNLFVTNAGLLGIDLSEVDYAVLSHAHYDHGNGFIPFFGINSKAKLFLQESCGENCYSLKEEGLKYIGIPDGILENYQDRIEKVAGERTLMEGVRIIPHSGTGLDQVGRTEKMFLKIGDALQPDAFSHEQSLVFETEEGLVVFNSCSHAGADRIIKEVQDAYHGRKVHAMIGGFHLFTKTPDQVRAFAHRLDETGVQIICTGHCTGDEAYAILEEELGEKVQRFKTGLCLEIA